MVVIDRTTLDAPLNGHAGGAVYRLKDGEHRLLPMSLGLEGGSAQPDSRCHLNVEPSDQCIHSGVSNHSKFHLALKGIEVLWAGCQVEIQDLRVSRGDAVSSHLLHNCLDSH
jgi:hypothetical protein